MVLFALYQVNKLLLLYVTELFGYEYRNKSALGLKCYGNKANIDTKI